MNERELSKLSYLVQALARRPDDYEELLDLAKRDFLTHPSSDLQRALDALREAFGALVPKKGAMREEDLKAAARKLLNSGHAPSVAAGRSLAWAIENRLTNTSDSLGE